MDFTSCLEEIAGHLGPGSVQRRWQTSSSACWGLDTCHLGSPSTEASSCLGTVPFAACFVEAYCIVGSISSYPMGYCSSCDPIDSCSFDLEF